MVLGNLEMSSDADVLKDVYEKLMILLTMKEGIVSLKLF